MTSWEAAAAQKRDSILASFPKGFHRIDEIPSRDKLREISNYVDGFLSPEEVSITHSSVPDILKQTTSGGWKAYAVTLAFCKRAALAHQLTNCLHEAFFSAALSDAEALDADFAKTGRPKGPLHGLPVSLKDQFHVRGVGTTLGFVGWIDTFEGRKDPSKEKKVESTMAQLLREAGAVLFCKTATPQASQSIVSENNIIDYVWNPNNRLLSAGGSSGGEGALVSARGSPLGVATDIAASVRVPANYNGLWGLCTSVGRLPFRGAALALDGQEALKFTPGPVARHLEGCKVFMKAVLGTKPWESDPECVDLPWREDIASSVLEGGKLTFGVFKDSGIVRVLPPIQRAIDRLVEALKKQGHEVIEWNPPPHKNLESIALEALRLDGATSLFNAYSLSGEPPVPALSNSYGKAPKTPSDAMAVFKVNVAKREACQAYMDYWNNTAKVTKTRKAVDAVISPVAPYPAARRGASEYLGYTSWVSVLDYTSLAVPLGTVDEKLDKVPSGFVPRDDLEKSIWESYDPEIYHGAPVGVQLVGRRFQEEKMLAIGEVVEKALKAFDGTKARAENL